MSASLPDVFSGSAAEPRPLELPLTDPIRAASSRRIVALVMPELLIELVNAAVAGHARGPWGVVLAEPAEVKGTSDEALRPNARLDAVSASARRCGVRAGQTIAEARALIAGFTVEKLQPLAVERALAAIAEVALGFGATVSVGLPDTVWVDVSASAHLFGGEAALTEELAERVRALGHTVRVAVAEGPALARAVARWALPNANGKALHCVPTESAAEAVSSLPVLSLPLSDECQEFLMRLGVLTLGDLAALPRTTIASRLAGEVGRALDLARGLDPTPLVPYQLPELIVEEVSFEYGLDGIEPLLFALRGIAARLAARLAGRGVAAEKLVLELEHDRSIARLRAGKDRTKLVFALSSPLTREDELRRVVSSRLERARLPSPTVALRLVAPSVVSATARQLELGDTLAGKTDIEKELPLVIAELAADVGETKVGVLKILDAHRLEARSTLVPALPPKPRSAGRGATRRGPGPRSATPLSVHVSGTPLEVVEGMSPFDARAPLTRLLPTPVRFEGALRIGATVAFERQLFTIEALRFEHRLHAVEWWNGAPVTRDYIRVWLRSTESLIEAVVYVDRANGKRYLQAVAD
jgi:protein ImuB